MVVVKFGIWTTLTLSFFKTFGICTIHVPYIIHTCVYNYMYIMQYSLGLMWVTFAATEDKVGQVQPETQLLMDWMMRTQPILTLMLRSGYQGVTTPSYGELNPAFKRLQCFCLYANSLGICHIYTLCTWRYEYVFIVVNLTKPEMSMLDHVGRKFTDILAKLEEPGKNCKGKF